MVKLNTASPSNRPLDFKPIVSQDIVRNPLALEAIAEDAAQQFSVLLQPEIQARYRDALNLMAARTVPHLRDWSGTLWVPPSGDRSIHHRSLRQLGKLLIQECEAARPAKPVGPKPNRRMKTATRIKLSKALLFVAKALKSQNLEAVVQSERLHKRLAGNEKAFGNLASLSPAQLANFLELVVDEINTNPTIVSRQNAVPVETRLAGSLVRHLRIATGGEPQSEHCMPINGRPLFDVAAAFVQAAGWRKMTGQAIRYRLSEQSLFSPTRRKSCGQEAPTR